MIAIPIALFVAFILFGVILVTQIVVSIVGYIKYCHRQDKKIDKKIGEKYGTYDEIE